MSKSDRDRPARPRSGKSGCTGCPACGRGPYKSTRNRGIRHQKTARIAEQLG